jgi:hypothetical protein
MYFYLPRHFLITGRKRKRERERERERRGKK